MGHHNGPLLSYVVWASFAVLLISTVYPVSPTPSGDDDNRVIITNATVTPEVAWFVAVNGELRLLNRAAAALAWNLSVQPAHDGTLVNEMAQLAQRKVRWQEQVCLDGERYRQLGWPYDRALYLLCRGPRNTPVELTAMAKLFAEVQSVYTDSAVCLPADMELYDSGDALWSNTFVTYPGLMVSRLDLSLVSPPGVTERPTTRPPTELTCYRGEPDLEDIIASEGPANENVLRWAWESWRMAVGPPMRQPYERLIGLMNAGAERADLHDIGYWWRLEMDVPELRQLVEKLWAEVKPFYRKLHAVVRYFVRQKFPHVVREADTKDKIPAHLLGNLWSHNWEVYAPLILPHHVDIGKSFSQANWTALDLVKRAEDLYASVGLPRLGRHFWEHSLFENAAKCHGTAANMYADGDFRVILCAKGSLQDFYVVIHEMGHIQYYMAAAKQPTVFQEGTNAAFQEAIGDSVYLAAITPQHLVRLGLLDARYMAPTGTNPLNSFDYALLLRTALSKIPQVPFEYLMDRYRWDLFDGTVDYHRNANRYYWYLLGREQGIKPPLGDTAHRFDLFDAGAKYHLADNTPYAPYFLASFLSYQIYESLCRVSLYGTATGADELPMALHRCDLYGSKKAGKLLEQALGLGASAHWAEVLELLTGGTDITSASMLKYYEPLIAYLDQLILTFRIPVGWW